ncbi:restriction endonuclease subunit S [Nitrincola nitratireducens]|uniref:Type I restriction enzyme EcoKI specificity protein n=1 Tax=Nitrincola nitratireducens TaxID=1229521 RepID=W9UWY1_9GAMM|nr:restriction endonuclease subunit S [Nitrincola nitratireducens]EXJ11748.1 Type I restriction enzyme EcoKI specificity protein [Nitrincola nitratireducens]
MSEIRLPSEWLTTNLEMIGEVVTGKTPSKKNSEYFGGAIPFIKPGDVNDQGNIEFTDEHLTELGAATVPTIPKGSIVVTCIGNLGRCAITTERSATNQQINSVLPFSNVDLKFIYYQMRTLKEWMVSESSATTVTIINKSKFSQAPLVLPPLAEQKVIAEKLDTLLAQVDNTKNRLERIPEILKRFRKSVLAAAVSGKLTEEWRGTNDYETRGSKLLPIKWDVAAAKDVCVKVQSGSTPRDNPFDQDGSIPFLKVYNIVNQKVDFDYKPQFVTDNVHKTALKRSAAMPNDILMNIVGPPLGKVAVLTDQYPEWNLNQAITLFRVDPSKLNHLFLYHVLCEGELVREVMPDTKGSVGQVNISLSQCRDALLPVPSLEEQTEIVRRVEELFAFADRIEQAAQAALSRVNNLTQSILAKAFRGELTADWRAANPELISGEHSAEALLARIKSERAKLKPKKAAK